MRNTIYTVLVSLAFIQIVIARISASAQDCDKVLENGVFNTTLIASDQNLERAFNEYIYDSTFATHEQAISAGLALGAVVYGVPLKLGGTFTKQERDTWRRTHQQYKNDNVSLTQKYAALTRLASPDTLDAWTKCQGILRSTKVGLYAWIEDVSSSAAVLHITWIPMAGDTGKAPIVLSSSMQGGSRADNGTAVPLPKRYELQQGANGNLVGLTRIPKESLVVVVNTTRGDVSCVLPAPPKPRIVSFTASPEEVQIGSASTLVWSVSKADSVTISNDGGGGSASGSTRVTPSQTTEYVLTATNPSGSDTAKAKVRVNIPPPPSFSTVLVTLHTESDDKDKEEAVEVWVLSSSGKEELAHKTVGKNEKWDNNTDFAVSLELNRSLLCTEGVKVRVFKHPHGSDTGCGWHMALSAFGTCSDGRKLVLKARSGTTFMGDGSENAWDRTW